MNKNNYEKNSNDSSFELIPSLIDSNLISNDNINEKKDSINIINDYIEIPNNKVRKSSYSQEHKQNIDSLFIDLSNESNDNCDDNYVNKNEEKNIKEQLKKFEKIENLKTKDIDCKFIDNNEKNYDCKIKFNNYKIILEILNYKKLFNEKYYIIPFSNILKKDEIKKNYFLNKDSVQINLITKDFRSFKLKFLKLNSYEIFNIVYDKYIMPKENIKVLIPSFWFKKQSRKKFKINGWELYSFEKEFELQKLKNIKSEFSKFQIIINDNYSICKTYPLKCIIPNNISIKDLKICAEYRTKNRFPALTYFYSINNKCIYRSSQNMIGIFGNKNNKDVELLTKISQNFPLDIYDCRPQTNAFANKINNGGYENPEHYPNIKVNVIFCDMQNIHCVRGYYKNLCETLYLEYSKNLFSNIEKSQWYTSIVILIESSFKIYNSIIKGNNVLVHCSDGWDRTTQLCSMSQILLEKRYRTIDGFINLIEKDWLSFGHQFKYRNNYTNIENSKEFCPIFIQFLDGLYQIMKQNYCEFEYNFDFLVFLAKECLNGRYGTFLFNNDYERKIYNAYKYTVSVWDYVKENEMQFINPLYNNNNEYNNKNKSIQLSFNPKKICFWRDYFLRYEINTFNECKKYTEKFNELKKDNEIKNKALSELFEILLLNQNKINFVLSDEVNEFLTKNNYINPQNSYVVLSMTESDKELLNKINNFEINKENDTSSDGP